MRKEHAAAAVAGESDLVQHLPDILVLPHVADGLRELLPLVCDYLAAAEATNWDDHLFISPIIISQYYIQYNLINTISI